MKVLRLMAAVGALVFLMSTAPMAASAPPAVSCAACDNCHPGLPCFMCASLVMHAIGNCCGAIGGWASCVNNEWGFFASCNGTPRWCQCSDSGDTCMTLIMVDIS
jgi:hypothetical protein